MATVYSLICSGGSGGATFTGMSVAQKARYGASGSERVYNGLLAWRTARVAATGANDTEVCEIGDAFNDTITSQFDLNLPCASVLITPTIDGAYTSAWHGEVYGAGYKLYINAAFGIGLFFNGFRHVIESINIWSTANSCQITRFSGQFNAIKKCFIVGNGTGNAQTACLSWSSANEILHNTIVGCNIGISPETFASNGNTHANNLVTKCGTGFVGGTGIKGFFTNNMAIDNTTENWGATFSSIVGASNNFGPAGSQPWYKGADTSIKTLTTAHFVNHAANDFHPASSLAPQVNTGVVVVGIAAEDIGGNYRPNYVNVATDQWDGGPYEYDHGNGLPPSTVDVDVTGLITGSRVKIETVSGGTSLYNGVVSGTSLSFPQTVGGDTPVNIFVRKGSAAPYYQPYQTSATIDDVAGLGLSVTQIANIAASTYAAGVATDWAINTGTLAITHASGATRYDVQDLYAWLLDYYDDSGTVDLAMPMYGITSTIFQLINAGAISDADKQLLKGGSIEEQDGTLWSNVYTVGSLSGTPDIYLYQGTTKLTAFWPAGHIDILAKVKNAGTLISSGLMTGYARKWGYTYDHFESDLSDGGRNVLPLATLADANITQTEATVAGWSDVALTFGTSSLDFGDGDGNQTYYCRIDCNDRPLSEVYQRGQYVTRAGSAVTVNGIPGDRYQSAHNSMTPVKSAPFGTYSGGVWSVAPGVWLDNVPSGDAYNYIVTDASGGTHQNVQALFQSVTVSNLVAGSRVQIYDATNDEELFNDLAATASVSWEDTLAPAGDRAIRVRITYVDGIDARKMIEADIGTCGTAEANKDVSYRASQVSDAVYIDNAVDGSTVTNITINDAVDLVQIAIPGGTVPWKDIYAYQVYWLNTETGIQDDFGFMEAIDQANYVLSGFLIKNTSSPIVPLKITGGYGRDAVTGSVADIFDTSGGSIFPVVDHVVSNVITVSGSSVITGDIADIPGYVPTAAAIAAQVENSTKLTGLAKIHGLIEGTPLVVTPTTRTAGDVNQTIAQVGDTVTVTRT